MDPRSRSGEVLSNERGLILGWMAKLAIGFILVGIVIFDGGSILVNFFTLDSSADEIAIELTLQTGIDSPNQQELEASAKELAGEVGARLLSVSVDSEKIVHIKLRRRADTLVVGRISFIRNWARATVEGQAGST